MAIIEDFNSYNNGDLNGQGSWTADVAVDVQGTTVQEGAKAIIKAAGSGLTDSTKAITALTVDGDQISFFVRSTISNDAGGATFGAFFRTSSTKLFTIQFNQDSAANVIRLVGATTVTLLSSPAINTWYLCTIEFDFAGDRARAKIDTGSFSSYVSAVGSVAFANVDGIGLQFGGTIGDVFLDNFRTIIDRVTLSETQAASDALAARNIVGLSDTQTSTDLLRTARPPSNLAKSTTTWSNLQKS